MSAILGGSGGVLARLVTQANVLRRLQRLLENSIEPELAAHCAVASLEAGQVVIHADSGGWATRLRFQTRGLLAGLARLGSGVEVKGLRVRVRPPPASACATTGKSWRAHLSDSSAELVNATARDIADPQLRASLVRLARRGVSRQR